MTRSADSLCVLIVDDERPARKRLAQMLAVDPDVSEIREAANGAEAVKSIQKHRPDVVFLDVQMPGVDGLGVINALGAEKMPLTVFVTGYEQFAIKAFEAEAVDYLLKPFADARYEQTMRRVKARLRELRASKATDFNSFGPELLELAAKRFKPGEIWEWMAVKDRRGTRLLMTEEIDWIEAADTYVTLHAGTNEYLYRAGMGTVASHLDPFRFVRIHRSSIVNLRSVAFLERRSHGEFNVALKNGARLLLSRTYRGQLESLLGQTL
jgi:two-component system LytT family response regulator